MFEASDAVVRSFCEHDEHAGRWLNGTRPAASVAGGDRVPTSSQVVWQWEEPVSCQRRRRHLHPPGHYVSPEIRLRVLVRLIRNLTDYQYCTTSIVTL